VGTSPEPIAGITGRAINIVENNKLVHETDDLSSSPKLRSDFTSRTTYWVEPLGARFLRSDSQTVTIGVDELGIQWDTCASDAGESTAEDDRPVLEKMDLAE